MLSLHVEMLLGHDTGLSMSYYRPSQKTLFEDYLKAVEVLTISQENKLIFENQQMKTHNESIQREKDELNLLRKQLLPLLELKSALIKEGILQEEQ